MSEARSLVNKSFFPHLLNAYLNWNNDLQGRCNLVISLADLDDPVLHAHKVPETELVILNIGGSAIKNLIIGETEISFECRLSGNMHLCVIPYSAITSVMGLDNVPHPLVYVTVDDEIGAILNRPPVSVVPVSPTPPTVSNDKVVPLKKKNPFTLVK